MTGTWGNRPDDHIKHAGWERTSFSAPNTPRYCASFKHRKRGEVNHGSNWKSVYADRYIVFTLKHQSNLVWHPDVMYRSSSVPACTRTHFDNIFVIQISTAVCWSYAAKWSDVFVAELRIADVRRIWIKMYKECRIPIQMIYRCTNAVKTKNNIDRKFTYRPNILNQDLPHI